MSQEKRDSRNEEIGKDMWIPRSVVPMAPRNREFGSMLWWIMLWPIRSPVFSCLFSNLGGVAESQRTQNRMDIISTIKHFFHEFITFKYRKSYLWIINLRYILMSHISKLLDNNSKSEILLSDIKDYAIIPLGFLDYRRNAFIYITNLIRSFSNGLGWSSF